MCRKHLLMAVTSMGCSWMVLVGTNRPWVWASPCPKSSTIKSPIYCYCPVIRTRSLMTIRYTHPQCIRHRRGGAHFQRRGTALIMCWASSCRLRRTPHRRTGCRGEWLCWLSSMIDSSAISVYTHMLIIEMYTVITCPFRHILSFLLHFLQLSVDLLIRLILLADLVLRPLHSIQLNIPLHRTKIIVVPSDQLLHVNAIIQWQFTLFPLLFLNSLWSILP